MANCFFTGDDMAQGALHLLGGDAGAFLRLSADGRIIALTDAAAEIVRQEPLRPLGEVLGAHAAAVVRQALAERSEARVRDVIDGRLWELRLCPTDEGALVYFCPPHGTALLLDDLYDMRMRALIGRMDRAAGRLGEAGEAMQRELHQMLRLLRQGALLTGTDALPRCMRPGDVTALCREAAEQLARRSVVPVVVEGEPVEAVFEPRELTEAVCNLLTNAVRTPGVQQVRVRVRTDGRNVFLSVADDGRPLPPERFAALCGDWSRPTDAYAFLQGAGGVRAGLGLPVVCEIALRHSGRLLLEPDGTLGKRLTLVFPCDLRGDPPSVRSTSFEEGIDLYDVELSVLDAD